jgi:hypothetical protein
MTAATVREAFERATEHSIWSVPDMTVLDNGRRPAVPMPGTMFGPVWSIIEDVADTTATAPDYAATAYLASAASLIGGKRIVRPYGDWREPCILWCAALGEPSSRKSPPLAMMTKPLWAIQEDAKADHDEAMRGWSAEVERAKAEKAKWGEEVKKAAGTTERTPDLPALAVEPDKPRERRTIISDVTPEAAADVLAGNPQGVLCYCDELKGWFDGFDRYAVGGRPFWLSAFGGRPHNVTRKGSGSLHIKFNGISVLGGVQPDIIAPFLSAGNDGLVPRILWAWPEKLPPRIPQRRADLSGLESAYRRLESLRWGEDENGGTAAVVLPLSDRAVQIFHAWEKANAETEGAGGTLYEGFCGKMGGTVARLALVAELTHWAFHAGAEPVEVSAASVAAAIELVEEYFKPMAARVFGDAAVTAADRNASLLARYIRSQKLETVNLREMRRHPHKGHLKPLQPKEALEAAVEVLEQAAWLVPDFHREGHTPGQPRKDYRVNPAVHGGRK